MAVELANDFSRGSIYFVDPLTPLVACSNCQHYFVAHYSAKVEKFTCDHCGNECDPDFVQRGKRPVLIVQNPTFVFFNTISVIPITSQEKAKDKIGAVHLPAGKPSGLTKDSWALVWQIRTINKNLFFKENYLGKVSAQKLKEIKATPKKHLLL
jgi:mRNA-degrading endonuclease toxin of MazEF toxin-antitoxin module